MENIPLFKIVIAGDGAVGKTALVRQYCEGKFEQSRLMTIGVDFQTKLVSLPEGDVKLSIWDMAGQERFAVVRSGFYRGAVASALVYDLTNPVSLDNLVKWHAEITQTVPNIRFVVVGNKADLVSELDEEKAMDYALSLNANYIRTSAMTGEGVPYMFETLARLAMKKKETAP
jgi:small GTP-binding protein